MNPITNHGRRIAGAVALACSAVLLSITSVAAVAGPRTSTRSGVVGNCQAASTEVWAAVEGVGTAGTTYYELEFSNIGLKSCKFHGYPSVWAITKNGVQVGRPASTRGVASTVTLLPGATAHAILGVVDTGAVCARQRVSAAGLRVVPPGQSLAKPPGESDEVENFAVEVCPSQSSMNVLPVRAGTGIPNYTFS